MEKSVQISSFLSYNAQEKSCKISCYIQVKASRNSIVGIHDNQLKISLTAPPVDGKANAMLIKFLANFFKKPKGDFDIICGESSRRKIIAIRNITQEDITKLNVTISEN